MDVDDKLEFLFLSISCKILQICTKRACKQIFLVVWFVLCCRGQNFVTQTDSDVVQTKVHWPFYTRWAFYHSRSKFSAAQIPQGASDGKKQTILVPDDVCLLNFAVETRTSTA